MLSNLVRIRAFTVLLELIAMAVLVAAAFLVHVIAGLVALGIALLIAAALVEAFVRPITRS
jgi:hypothetical protein